jgi:hypothetical protein
MDTFAWIILLPTAFASFYAVSWIKLKSDEAHERTRKARIDNDLAGTLFNLEGKRNGCRKRIWCICISG